MVNDKTLFLCKHYSQTPRCLHHNRKLTVERLQRNSFLGVFTAHDQTFTHPHPSTLLRVVYSRWKPVRLVGEFKIGIYSLFRHGEATRANSKAAEDDLKPFAGIKTAEGRISQQVFYCDETEGLIKRQMKWQELADKVQLFNRAFLLYIHQHPQVLWYPR